MNFLGLHITTRKKHLDYIKQHDDKLNLLKAEINDLEEDIENLMEQFPFGLGQVVYDVALKNAQGKYTKTRPSFEHSTITEVIVDEKNYFKLVARFNRKDVFYFREDAEEYLKSICK